MARLKNKGPAVDLYRTEGHPESVSVKTGQVVEVPGRVSGKGEDSDCFVIGTGDNALAFSKELWELDSDGETEPTAKVDPKKAATGATTEKGNG